MLCLTPDVSDRGLYRDRQGRIWGLEILSFSHMAKLLSCGGLGKQYVEDISLYIDIGFIKILIYNNI